MNIYLNTIENKVSKNIGILYKAKEIINTKGLRNLYYLFIHTFLNYGNLLWGSKHNTNLKKKKKKKKNDSRQKQENRIINSKTVRRTAERLEKLRILNIYKINISQSLIFIFSVKNNTIPYVFHERFTSINHQYPTRLSQNNFSQRKIRLSQTKFAISLGPRLWNNILTPVQKQ